MSITEGSNVDKGPFRSRILAKIGIRRVERAIDPIPPDARERAGVLFDRLAEERERRGVDTYEVLDERSRIWEVKLLTEPIGVVSSSFFRLRREQTVARGWLLYKNPGIISTETFTIYPWFVSYSDFTSSPFEYFHLNSTKTLDAAEKTIISLFPDFIPFQGISNQALAAPAPVNG